MERSSADLTSQPGNVMPKDHSVLPPFYRFLSVVLQQSNWTEEESFQRRLVGDRFVEREIRVAATAVLAEEDRHLASKALDSFRRALDEIKDVTLRLRLQGKYLGRMLKVSRKFAEEAELLRNLRTPPQPTAGMFVVQDEPEIANYFAELANRAKQQKNEISVLRSFRESEQRSAR